MRAALPAQAPQPQLFSREGAKQRRRGGGSSLQGSFFFHWTENCNTPHTEPRSHGGTAKKLWELRLANAVPKAFLSLYLAQIVAGLQNPPWIRGSV